MSVRVSCLPSPLPDWQTAAERHRGCPKRPSELAEFCAKRPGSLSEHGGFVGAQLAMWLELRPHPQPFGNSASGLAICARPSSQSGPGRVGLPASLSLGREQVPPLRRAYACRNGAEIPLASQQTGRLQA